MNQVSHVSHVRSPAGILLGLIVLSSVLACSRRTGPPQIGAPVPDFTLPDLAGKQVRLGDYRGKVVILNFWGTFCPPCVEEMPSLEKLYRALRAKGLEVVAVSVDESVSDIEAFRDRFGLSFLILHDKDARVAKAYQTFKYPETYVVDRDGKLVSKAIGAVDWIDPPLIHRFVGLLGTNGF